MNTIAGTNSNRIFNISNNSTTTRQGNNPNKSESSNKNVTTNSLKGMQKSNNSLVTSLQKNIEQLEEQKKTLKDQKLDPKNLLEKSKKIDEQISEVKAQIQQAILDQKQADAEKLQEDIENKKLEEEKYTKNGDEIRDGVIISSTLNVLIEANRTNKTYHDLKELKSRYGTSDTAIAKRIDATISKELGKTNKAIEKELSHITKEHKRSINTINTDNEVEEAKNTNETDPQNSDNIEKAKDKKTQN